MKTPHFYPFGAIAIRHGHQRRLREETAPGRGWNTYRARATRRLAALLTRALAAGDTVTETAHGGGTQAWNLEKKLFIPSFNTPANMGKHIAARVVGFGWKVTIAPTITHNQTEGA